MTEQEQRIEIAKACGWLEVMPSGRLDGQHVGYHPQHAVIGKREEIPDYPNDLNACHEMEKHLNGYDEMVVYCRNLTDLLCADNANAAFHLHPWIELHSTPQMRCKAFLETKKLWKD